MKKLYPESARSQQSMTFRSMAYLSLNPNAIHLLEANQEKNQMEHVVLRVQNVSNVLATKQYLTVTILTLNKVQSKSLT